MKKNFFPEATDIVAQTEIAVQSGSISPLLEQLLKAQAGALTALPNAKFSIEPGKFEVQFKLPKGTLNLGLRQYDKMVTTTSASFAESVKPKYRLMPAITKLRSEGMTQNQVAMTLGMSQGYVSVLERKYKHRHNVS